LTVKLKETKERAKNI